jgi:quercetin dioxygenase-like cupin family protein
LGRRRLAVVAIVVATAATAVIWVLAGPAKVPQGQGDFKAEKVFQGPTTMAGQPIEFSRSRNQFTALMVELGPGAQTGRHKYLVPSFVYIVQGTLTLSVEGHGSQTFRAGQGLAAALNVWHNAANREQAATRFLVIHVGGQEQKPEEWPVENSDWVRTLLELGVI